MLEKFSEACYICSNYKDLAKMLKGSPDPVDLTNWNLTEKQWYTAVRKAFYRMKDNVARGYYVA